MIFEYLDMNNRRAHCDIERVGNLVIMTELADNPGGSVTNSCEYIIPQYVGRNNIEAADLVFIERYDERSYNTGRPATETSEFPNYSTVTFSGSEWIPGKLTPKWQYLKAEDFEEMVARQGA